MRKLVSVAFASATVIVPLAASAQWYDGRQNQSPSTAPTSRAAAPPSCSGGRVANDLTLYRCCWPGQVWNDEHARCSGPPACPSGMDAHGEDCVVASAPNLESGDAIISRAAEEDRQRQATRGPVRYTGGDVPYGFRVERRDHGMPGVGVALMAIGYAPSLITGIYALGAGRPQTPLAWSFIPVVGMPAAFFACLQPPYCSFDSGWALAFVLGGSISATMQLAGLIVSLVGISRPQYLVPDDGPHSRIEWHLSPWATPMSAGAAFTMTL